MMKIKNSSSSDVIKKVSFKRTLYTGKTVDQYIEVNKSPFDDEGNSVSIEFVNLQIEDIPEFIEAVKLAAKIASGELEIE